MGNRKINQYLDIIIVVLFILVIDVLLKSYFETIYKASANGLIVLDLVASILAIFFGRYAAIAIGLPIWQVKYNNETKKQILFVILLGAAMVALNTLIWYKSDSNIVSWTRFSNIAEPIFVSMRAALTEEVFFRLLGFSVISLVASKLTQSTIYPFIIGALLSSAIFALYHQGFYLAFVYGLLLCYIYKRNGLLSAMAIHFLSDVIPFIMIYMK